MKKRKSSVEQQNQSRSVILTKKHINPNYTYSELVDSSSTTSSEDKFICNAF